MFVIRQCDCGCKYFEREPDDDVLRCEECGSLAKFTYINEDTAKVDVLASSDGSATDGK